MSESTTAPDAPLLSVPFTSPGQEQEGDTFQGGDAFEGEGDAQPGGRRRLEPSVRFYIAVWLPAAGALLAYAALRGSIWAGFVGLELLVVGWYTLAAL